MANGKFGGGNGSASNPFLVEDAFDLDAIRNNLNACYKQIADINFNGSGFDIDSGWLPIGTGFNDVYFRGTYDGNGYKIFNLYIDRAGYAGGAGLFGSVADGCNLLDIHLINVNIARADNSCGGLVGYARGNVEISNCSSEGVIKSISTAGHSTGGLIGSMGVYVKVVNCHSSGVVNGSDSTGGLIGRASNNTEIRNCHSNCTVNAKNEVGGFIGTSGGAVISSSFATGNVYGSAHVGGFMGIDVGGSGGYPTVSQYCFANGDVFGSACVGGFIGSSDGYYDGYIHNCYAIGDVAAMTTGDKFGAFAGQAKHTIVNCYATGHIAGNTNLGGFLGYDNGVVMSSCVWNIETTGQTTSAGSGAVGKTTAQMKERATYQELGWVI